MIDIPQYTPQQIEKLLTYMTPDERKFVEQIVLNDPAIWRPLPGPQSMAYYSKADVIGYGGAAGGGKLSPLDEPVLTPTGWRAIGDLQVGDYVIDPTTGAATNVIGVFPQGVKDIYRVTCDDGAQCEVGLAHLWLYRRTKGRRPGTKPAKQRAYVESCGLGRTERTRWTTQRVGPTSELIAMLGRGDQPRIPLMEPALFTVNGRTGTGRLEPYLLGLYLGDGCYTGSITSCDDEIRDYLLSHGLRARSEVHSDGKSKEFGFAGKLKRALVDWLQDNGLSGKRSWEKFIPGYVFTAPVDYRHALLQGLMDTDGTVDKRGRCYFTSTSEPLARGVQALVRSLGGKASIRERQPSYTHNGEFCAGRKAYQVRAWMRCNSALFRLSRKRERCTDSWNGGGELTRAITSIERARQAEAVCIKVASPSGLYVTTDYIVTHNTDLLIGKALTQHRKVLMVRRYGTELGGIHDRLVEVLGSDKGFSGKGAGAWRLPHVGNGLQIVYGAVPHPGDETKHQGRPKDLLALEEAANLLEQQARFLMGWVRTVVQGQPAQTLMTFNPPTSSDGQWIIDYYAPWIDPMYPVPADPGELRYFVAVEGKDREVVDKRQRVYVGDTLEYYDRERHKDIRKEDILTPLSRTFIPAKVSDNPYLMGTGYMATLQALPEPLRSQMLHGDFTAGMQDDAWQVVPTEWVKIAMSRWKKRERKNRMDSMGVDVARGGQDNTILYRRHEDWWFDDALVYPGLKTPDGPAVAGLVVAHLRDRAPIHIDIVGVGASPYDYLAGTHQTIGVNGGEGSTAKDCSGLLGFVNLRSQIIWRIREVLDPGANNGIAIPPEAQLLRDLTAYRWKPVGKLICVESREELIKRIGRSADWGSAFALACMETPRIEDVQIKPVVPPGIAHDPYEHMGGEGSRGAGHNPYE